MEQLDLVLPNPATLAEIGQLANHYAARNAFADYQGRLDPNTLLRQQDDLAHYSLYLQDAGVRVSTLDLFTRPESWAGTTHGLIQGFVQWMLLDGYSIGTVNIRLSTVRTYAKLAAAAGVIPATELVLIVQVKGYSHAHGQNVDAQRQQTRKGAKKAQPVPISAAERHRLKQQPDTPQGRRDALLMYLLLDHGLHCGDVACSGPVLSDAAPSTGSKLPPACQHKRRELLDKWNERSCLASQPFPMRSEHMRAKYVQSKKTAHVRQLGEPEYVHSSPVLIRQLPHAGVTCFLAVPV